MVIRLPLDESLTTALYIIEVYRILLLAIVMHENVDWHNMDSRRDNNPFYVKYAREKYEQPKPRDK